MGALNGRFDHDAELAVWYRLLWCDLFEECPLVLVGLNEAEYGRLAASE